MIGGSLIRVAGPTIAFRLFTVLAVIFILIFTTGLTSVNFRDSNYYSVLLNTFNICIDTKRSEQTKGGNINNTSGEDHFNEQDTTISFCLEAGKSNSQKEDWGKY